MISTDFVLVLCSFSKTSLVVSFDYTSQNTFQSMSDFKDIFETVENQNWVKCWFAVEIARRGLLELCKDVIRTLHSTILSKVPPGPACKTCKLHEVIPYSISVHKCKRGKCSCPSKRCNLKVCDTFRAEIEKEHKYNEISWKNTNVEEWRNNPWEIAKCFFPRDGYKAKKDAEDTDFNGIANLLINNNLFRNYLSKSSLQLCEKVRMIYKVYNF